MNGPAIIILSAADKALAQRMAEALGGSVHGLAGRVDAADHLFADTKSHLQKLYSQGQAIIAVMASGALIRLLAPVIADKGNEPPVVAVSADGSSAVPLLGGHRGANELAQKIAAFTDGHAAVTTAGDIRFGVALDAPPAGYKLANPRDAKAVMAALNNGASARLEGEAAWLSASAIPFADDGSVRLTVSDRITEPSKNQLIYHPATLVLGMGCERGVSAQEAIALAEETLARGGWSPASLACVASIDLKADEAAIHTVADHFAVPARFFDAARLEEEAHRLDNPSEIVFAEVGCHGVAEGAALAAAGADAVLVEPKRKSKRATGAIARAAAPITEAEGRGRGRLFVVGIGPGSQSWRSPEAGSMITAATDLVGYSLYLDLIDDLSAGKKRHDFDLGREEDRVRHAMELAGQGCDVALICSGDAGIYAMATLVFELLAEGSLSDGAARIDIAVAPGISALQGAAARAGAPLGHDFCTISLSDLLTPWEDIQRRVRAAGEGDFVIAFYNPVSRKRRTQLAWARDELLQHRPDDTPVILATNLGRDGETIRVVRLADLQVDDVDMLTVVLVGSSDTRAVMTGGGRQWVYTPRGYAGKRAARSDAPGEAAQ